VRLDGQEVSISSHLRTWILLSKRMEKLIVMSTIGSKRWLKWRSVIGVLCDRNILLWLKEKFYRTAIRPALLYDTELSYKGISCPEDECSRDDASLDVR